MENVKSVILPGSYDPVTLGHEDLILRSAAIFDCVYAVILSNTEKDSRSGGMFTPSEKLAMLEAVCESASRKTGKPIYACLWSGLTSDFAKENGVKFILKGARSALDFDYESTLADIMWRFDPELESVILPSRPNLSAISSTYCRDLIKYGCALEGAIPEEAIKIMRSFEK